jgi:hypothetical protein
MPDPMGWDCAGPLAYLQTLIAALPSVANGTVYQGEPTVPDSRVAAMVSVGGFQLNHETTGTMIRQQHYWVELYYRVGGDEAAAEGVIAQLIDELAQAWQDDLTLGGTALDTTIDASSADEPSYKLLRGPEWRTYNVLIGVKQRNVRPQ